jgi:phosphoribosyl-ATP pyrophosphohydrolase/phosphoribosyl-AMP cyclohydrolase
MNDADMPGEPEGRLGLGSLRFDDRGLIPVIVQDGGTGEVLILAWANREALERTVVTGEMHFYSRSREALWRKGETSGNTLRVREIRFDCDADAILALVDPAGPACHTGKRSCFHHSLWGEEGDPGTFLGALERVIRSRKDTDPASSYTARLFARGTSRIAQKVGEEGVEVALATATGGQDSLIEESSDLLYHLLVALAERDVRLEEVLACLVRRHSRRTGDGS